MYQRPICHCGSSLTFVEMHTHEIVKDITAAGKPGRTLKTGFTRNMVTAKLRCSKCGNTYAVKRNGDYQILRGRRQNAKRSALHPVNASHGGAHQ